MDKTLKEIAELLEKDQSVVFAYLYGSYLKDRATARDIDIAIYVKEYRGLLETECKQADRLREKLSRVTNRPVHVRVLNEAPVEFQLEVTETGRVIYVSDEDAFTDYLEELSRKAIQTIQYRYSIEGELCRL